MVALRESEDGLTKIRSAGHAAKGINLRILLKTMTVIASIAKQSGWVALKPRLLRSFLPRNDAKR
jgi:hypothetical protein